MAQKWPKMTQNNPKWPKYDRKWPKMVQHGPRMTQNDPKWPKTDPTWPKITPNGPNMTPGFTHFFRKFFLTEKAIPQTFSLLECMDQDDMIDKDSKEILKNN